MVVHSTANAAHGLLTDYLLNILQLCIWDKHAMEPSQSEHCDCFSQQIKWQKTSFSLGVKCKNMQYTVSYFSYSCSAELSRFSLNAGALCCDIIFQRNRRGNTRLKSNSKFRQRGEEFCLLFLKLWRKKNCISPLLFLSLCCGNIVWRLRIGKDLN